MLAQVSLPYKTNNKQKIEREISYFGNSSMKYKAIENVNIEIYKGEPIVKELN